MPNLALDWPVLQGVDMTPPDRLENVARLIAGQPSQALRHQWAAYVRKVHRPEVAEKVVVRAQALFREWQAAA